MAVVGPEGAMQFRAGERLLRPNLALDGGMSVAREFGLWLGADFGYR